MTEQGGGGRVFFFFFFFLNNVAAQEEQTSQFSLQRIYVKDLSFEAPKSPGDFP